MWDRASPLLASAAKSHTCAPKVRVWDAMFAPELHIAPSINMSAIPCFI